MGSWRAKHFFIGTSSLFARTQDLWSKVTRHHQLSIHIFQPHPGKHQVPVFRYVLFCRILSSPCLDLPERISISSLFFLMDFKIVGFHQEGSRKPGLSLKKLIDLLKVSLEFPDDPAG